MSDHATESAREGVAVGATLWAVVLVAGLLVELFS